jgi:spore coat protein CotH
MRVSGVRLCGLLLLVVAAPIAAPTASAQTQADLFNDTVLQEIRLVVSARDWQTLRATADQNTYYRADVKWNGITVRNVGIRSRGSGTRNGTKPGLKVDVNRYISNQEFVGLKAFILDNTYTDSSVVRESVTMKMFARMGVPAPREAHARLYINNEYAGIYTIVEAVDRTFVSRIFGSEEADVENGGYLYEYKYSFPYDLSYLGPELEAYAPLFEPQTRDTDSMTALYEPIEEMIRTINESADDDFAGAVGTYVDLPLLMKHLAVETFMVDWDGLTGNWGLNNFYLYRFRDSSRSQFIPWDKDETFQFADMDIMFRFDANVLVRRAMQVPALRAAYLDALRQCAAYATETAGEDTRGWLEREIDRQATQVAAAVADDPVFPVSFDQFAAEVERLRQFARVRPEFVTCEASNAVEGAEQRPCSIPPAAADEPLR